MNIYVHYLSMYQHTVYSRTEERNTSCCKSKNEAYVRKNPGAVHQFYLTKITTPSKAACVGGCGARREVAAAVVAT